MWLHDWSISFFRRFIRWSSLLAVEPQKSMFPWVACKQKPCFVTPVCESSVNAFSSHRVSFFITAAFCDEQTLLFVQLSCSLTQQHPLSQRTVPLRLLIELFGCQEGEKKENPAEFILMSIPPQEGPESSTWTTCWTTSERTNAAAPLVEASKHTADPSRAECSDWLDFL